MHMWQAEDGFDILIRRTAPRLAQSYDLEAYAAVRAACSIRAGVLVQAAPDRRESDQLLTRAGERASVAGVVAWVDLASADAMTIVSDWKARFGRKLLGVRAMLNRTPRADWILTRSVRRTIVDLAGEGLTLDVIAQPPHLGHLARLADAIPELRLVVDHAGTPPRPDAHDWTGWAGSIARLADHPWVSTKLSGFWEAAGARLEMLALKPTFDHLLDTFGGHRLMLATNWPVVELFGPASMWIADVQAWLDTVGSDRETRQRIFGGTAAQVYGLDDDRWGEGHGIDA